MSRRIGVGLFKTCCCVISERFQAEPLDEHMHHLFIAHCSAPEQHSFRNWLMHDLLGVVLPSNNVAFSFRYRHVFVPLSCLSGLQVHRFLSY